MVKEEKEVVTEDEALERVENNLETIESEYGKIRFNRNFFRTCAGVCLVSGGFGTGLLLTCGLAVAPVVATVFGVVGAAYSSIQLNNQNRYEKELEEDLRRNVETKQKIIEKSKKVR